MAESRLHPIQVGDALHRVHARVHHRARRLLKRHGLGIDHHDALRVLASARGGRMHSLGVGKRMRAQVPDITRLLDRLADRGWITRTRSQTDRRVVECKLLPLGREILRRVETPLRNLYKSAFSELTAAEARTLNELLRRLDPATE